MKKHKKISWKIVSKRRMRYDRLHGEGAAKAFLKYARRHSFENTGGKYHFTRQRASELFYHLGGRVKLVSWELSKPEITVEKICEEQTKHESLKSLALAFKTTPGTIKDRVGGRFKLPDGRGGNKKPRTTIEKIIETDGNVPLSAKSAPAAA